MAELRFTLSGDNDLDAIFKNLEPKVQKKVLRPALRAAAKIIQTEAKARAPVKSGALRDSIKVRAGARTRKGIVRVNVEMGEGNFKGETFYGAFLEYGAPGHKLFGRPNPLPPQPFMRPAFDRKKDEAREVAQQQIASGILAAAKE